MSEYGGNATEGGNTTEHEGTTTMAPDYTEEMNIGKHQAPVFVYGYHDPLPHLAIQLVRTMK